MSDSGRRYKDAQEFFDDCRRRLQAWKRGHYHNLGECQAEIIRRNPGKYPTVRWECRFCKSGFFEQVPNKKVDPDVREFFK